MKKFENPIYVTRPIIPNIDLFQKKLVEIWDSKIFSNQGKQHQLLEKELLEVLKVSYMSLFNNGTIALITAIKSLRISGDCITTAFSFPATPHALTWCGVKPIFCDITDDFVIDSSKIESLITPKTTGILGVHVFGIPCNVDQIQKIADFYGLKVIYDGAHSFQTEIDGKGIGNFGDITMFSFHPTKLFHTSEGGALTYSNSNFKKRIDLLKNFGIKNEEEVVMTGINGKLSEIQSAIGLVVLQQLEEERKKRELVLSTYKKYLKEIPGIWFYSFSDNIKNSLQYFVIKIDEKIFGKSRNYVYDKLKEFNIFTRKYFYPLCSDYTCYRHLESSKNLIKAKKIVNEVLCLPFYGDLSLKEVEVICSIIEKLRK